MRLMRERYPEIDLESSRRETLLDTPPVTIDDLFSSLNQPLANGMLDDFLQSVPLELANQSSASRSSDIYAELLDSLESTNGAEETVPTSENAMEIEIPASTKPETLSDSGPGEFDEDLYGDLWTGETTVAEPEMLSDEQISDNIHQSTAVDTVQGNIGSSLDNTVEMKTYIKNEMDKARQSKKIPLVYQVFALDSLLFFFI